MALFIGNERCDLYTIQNYQGDEIVRLKFKDAWLYLKEEFWDCGLKVRFRHTRMKYGEKRGIVGESFEFSAIESTTQGEKVIRYADSAVPQANGKIDYRPINLPWESRDMIFERNGNIEKCLFIYLYICKEGQSVDIKLLDEQKEARLESQKNERASAMWFYLYNKTSPLLADKEKLIQVCNVWGIPGAFRMSVEQMQNKLKTAIEVAENPKTKDKTRGYDAFEQAMTEGFSKLMEARSLVQRAFDTKKIAFNEQKKYFAYIDESGKETETLCKVPAVEGLRKREYLCDFVEKNTEAFEMLKSCLTDEPVKEYKKAEVPENITREYLEELAKEGKGFNIMKRMMTDNGLSWRNKTKEQILSALIEYFVLNKE